MAIVNQIEKKAKMSRWEIVQYQILTHCYINKVSISDADLNCLTYLAIEGDQELSSFCQKVFSKKIFSSTQSVRNSLRKVEKKNLIVKEGKNKKKIFVNPNMQVCSEGNILLNFKFISIAET
jgi:hypothetical protein